MNGLEPIGAKVDDALADLWSRIRGAWPLVTRRTLDRQQRNAFQLGRDAERLGL